LRLIQSARSGRGVATCSGCSGDGTTIDRSSPIALTSLPGPALIVAAGGNFTMALLADGTVWNWGSNLYGQLGDGTSNSRYLPGPVSGLTNGRRIAAGGAFALAVLGDNTVKGWGANYFGQVGDGSNFNNRLAPVTVPNFIGSPSWGIAAGDEHALAMGTYKPPTPVPGCTAALFRLVGRRRAKRIRARQRRARSLRRGRTPTHGRQRGWGARRPRGKGRAGLTH
jgi:hypothetical protein